jgi:hypothetical protein
MVMVNNMEDIFNYEDLNAETIGLIEFQATVLKLANKMIKNNFHPTDVASIMSNVALQMYKTSLSDQEYNQRIDYISRHRDRNEVFGQTWFGSTRSVH